MGEDSSGDSISSWIDDFRSGDERAVERIWSEYFPRLVSLARANLKRAGRAHDDEEDIALSAFKSFIVRAPGFPQLDDRDDLWKLLMTITLRKCYHASRKSTKYSPEDAQSWLKQLPNKEPSPEDAACATEVMDRMFSLMPDNKARAIVQGRLDGATNAEIARQVGCAVATVERKLRIAREILRADFD